jgi:hypothetical protein
MSEPRNTREILADAEHAASTGDFVSAEELLRDAAVRQEAELGPLHPDLANTLNNLAVVAEKSARLDDAETFYRRAVAIASASLPPNDPIVAASRQNLDDFCRAYGRPLDRPRVVEPAAAPPAPPPPTPTPSLKSSPPTTTPAPPTTAAPPATAAPPLPPVAAEVSREMMHLRATLAVGLVGLVIAALFVNWLRSPRQPSTAVRVESPGSPKTADLSLPAPRAVAPADRTPMPKGEPKGDRAPAVARTTGAVQLVTSQLCRSFSAGDFRCNPAGDLVQPGAIVLLTRVRSPRDSIILHQWYRGDRLRKTARLSIGANEAEGYRTYSRQTVDHGDWRVEVRSATGELLYEHRLAVR